MVPSSEWFLGHLKPQRIIEIWRSGHPQGVRKFHLHLLDLEGTASMNVQQTPLFVGQMVSIPEMSLQSIQSLSRIRDTYWCIGSPKIAIHFKGLRSPWSWGISHECGKVEEKQPNSPPKKASGMICISRSSPEFPMLAQAWKPPQVKVGKGSTQWSLEENLPVGIWHLWGPRLEFKRNSDWSNSSTLCLSELQNTDAQR